MSVRSAPDGWQVVYGLRTVAMGFIIDPEKRASDPQENLIPADLAVLERSACAESGVPMKASYPPENSLSRRRSYSTRTLPDRSPAGRSHQVVAVAGRDPRSTEIARIPSSPASLSMTVEAEKSRDVVGAKSAAPPAVMKAVRIAARDRLRSSCRDGVWTNTASNSRPRDRSACRSRARIRG
jgi:hypothetical protein